MTVLDHTTDAPASYDQLVALVLELRSTVASQQERLDAMGDSITTRELVVRDREGGPRVKLETADEYALISCVLNPQDDDSAHAYMTATDEFGGEGGVAEVACCHGDQLAELIASENGPGRARMTRVEPGSIVVGEPHLFRVEIEADTDAAYVTAKTAQNDRDLYAILLVDQNSVNEAREPLYMATVAVNAADTAQAMIVDCPVAKPAGPGNEPVK